MRILLTGCAGFIGWKVAEFLLQEEHTVVGVDNLNSAYDPRLKAWRLRQLEARRGFTFHHRDITDRDGLASLFGAPAAPIDAVINLAARAGVRQSLMDPWAYFSTNLTGALNLLELCRVRAVPKFVQASTSSVYGHAACPFREDQAAGRPLSPYAVSKKAAEDLCFAYHRLYAIDVSVLRYFTVYGPAARPDMMMFRFVQWISEDRPVTIFGDGLQSRDFTYVDDAARGTIAGLKRLGCEVINLGSDHPVVLMDGLRLLEKLLGKQARIEHVPHHPADALATWADIGKAKRLLDWRPGRSFEEGVEQTVRWYRDNRAWASEVQT